MEYWIRTLNDRIFDYSNPQKSNVDLIDMANALSHVNRFGGHTKTPYSVGQHSLFIHSLVSNSKHSDDIYLKKLALVHDFHEAYFGDMTSPLKWYLKDKFGFDANAYCDEIDTVIFDVLKMRKPLAEEKKLLKYYDTLALAIEQRFLQDVDPTSKIAPFLSFTEKDIVEIMRFKESDFNKFLLLQPGTVAIQIVSLVSRY